MKTAGTSAAVPARKVKTSLLALSSQCRWSTTMTTGCAAADMVSRFKAPCATRSGSGSGPASRANAVRSAERSIAGSVRNLPPTAATDLYVLPDVFRAAFANDIPRRQAAVLAATQRPVTLGALSEMSTEPAWKTIPSWYQVGTIDKVIIPAQQRMMARRAHSHTVEVRASHLPMISQPAAVARTIENAAYATT